LINVQEDQDHIKMTDGFGLFYRRWKVVGEVQKVIVCLPGIGGNSEVFGILGEALAKDGIEVYALDRRGFGNSVEKGLLRGDTSNIKRHLQDLEEAIGYIRNNHPGKKVFMLGHSLGGCYTLWYVANHSDSLDGMVLMAPSIVPGQKTPPGLAIKGFLSLLFAPKTMLPISFIFPETIRKTEEYKLFSENPLNATAVSARYLIRGVRPLQTKALDNASRTGTPTLVIQGGADTVVLPIGAKKLLDSLAAKDKSLQTFADADHFFYHVLFRKSTFQDDPLKRKQITGAVSDWIKAH
jgi:alpha-beta hydrolase superfamily lysophospholipase